MRASIVCSHGKDIASAIERGSTTYPGSTPGQPWLRWSASGVLDAGRAACRGSCGAPKRSLGFSVGSPATDLARFPNFFATEPMLDAGTDRLRDKLPLIERKRPSVYGHAGLLRLDDLAAAQVHHDVVNGRRIRRIV